MIEWPVAGKFGVPFMVAGVVAAKVNPTRIVEAVVIAIVSSGMMAGFGYFIALPVLQEQVGQMRRDIAETKDSIRAVSQNIDQRSTRRDAREAVTDAKIVQLQIEMARRK